MRDSLKRKDGVLGMFGPAVVGIFLIPALAITGQQTSVQSDQWREPRTFKSSHGVLDILMIARPMVTTFGEFSPQTWVYEICLRSASPNGESCPAEIIPNNIASFYGGTRLALQPGDKLKIRLVNQLPKAPDDAEHTKDDPTLKLNPTNLHTHGLIVEPRKASHDGDSYGDYIFVLTFPKGVSLPAPHPGMDFRSAYTDYEIQIPPDHPAGLFWFHPHAHGLALNQVSSGLAGDLTVGEIEDYICDDAGCKNQLKNVHVRHLILKDTEVQKGNTVLTQEDPGFCDGGPGAGKPQSGFCQAKDGGKWFFTINGQVYPRMTMDSTSGEIWRITNASASNTYLLALANSLTGADMSVQVLSVDGVSLSTSPGGLAMSQEMLRSRLIPAPCPSVNPAATNGTTPVCTKRIKMMPSSRVELWATYRDAHDQVAIPPANAGAVFKTYGFWTGFQASDGPTGDQWPAVNLAQITFAAGQHGGALRPLVGVKGQTSKLLQVGGMLFAQPQSNSGTEAAPDHHLVQDPSKNTDASASVKCQALAPGHVRRIFFGLPSKDSPDFGLGYEELDQNGVPVPGTFKDITPFDHSSLSVCLPLGSHNAPVSERWELVNVADEDHNFHIHQTKFWVVPTLSQTSLAEFKANRVLLDNVPLLNGGSGCDNTIQTWRSGNCHVKPVRVEIPFKEPGEFVYHCHILEHEDGGMMAKIKVLANNYVSGSGGTPTGTQGKE